MLTWLTIWLWWSFFEHFCSHQREGRWQGLRWGGDTAASWSASWTPEILFFSYFTDLYSHNAYLVFLAMACSMFRVDTQLSPLFPYKASCHSGSVLLTSWAEWIERLMGGIVGSMWRNGEETGNAWCFHPSSQSGRRNFLDVDEGTSCHCDLWCGITDGCRVNFHRGRYALASISQIDWMLNVGTPPYALRGFLET